MPLFPFANTVTVRYEDLVHVSGDNSLILGRLYWSASSSGSSPVQVGSQNGPFNTETGPVEYNYDVSGYSDGYVSAWSANNTQPNVNTVLVSYLDDLVFCQYGTRRKESADGVVILDAGILLNILSFIKSTFFWSAISIFAGRALDVGDLCSTDRPQEPHFDEDDILHLVTGTAPVNNEALLDKAQRWLQWAAWAYYCECAPGATTPVPFPNYPATRPVNLPDGPLTDYSCDNTDLCIQVHNLSLALNAMSQKLQLMDRMVTLIQRQEVPFAYLQGTVHSGLTGNGSFSVSGILGVSVNATAAPGYLGSDMDSLARSSYSFGWINLGTSDGFQRKLMVTHDPQLVLDVSPAITIVEYFLAPGVTATITELIREP